MARAMRQEAEPVNADSFLDIVASVVCIMLIMVLMIGMRIRNAPVDPATIPAAQQAGEELQQAQARESSVRTELTKITRQIDAIRQETAARRTQGETLATSLATMNRDLGEGRQQLERPVQGDVEVDREIAEVNRRLEAVHKRRQDIASASAEPIVVQSYPTPIGRTVSNDEVHFHLRLGRVAHVPIDKLVSLARDDARQKADKLLDRYEFMSNRQKLPEFTEIVGPENGFRFRYTAQRHDSVEDTPRGAVRYTGLRISHWTVIPVAGTLGETIDESLAVNSNLRRVLASMRPEKTTVTAWVYPDSFDAFRRFRKELHDLGYLVAARPLPEGVMIAGSPNGTKSEAE